MAVSGNQLTRLGAYLFGAAKKLVLTAKAPKAENDLRIGIVSTISDAGNGLVGFISSFGGYGVSAIVTDNGLTGAIVTDNICYSPINDTGNGLESTIL